MESVLEAAALVAEEVEAWQARSRLAVLDLAEIESGGWGDPDAAAEEDGGAGEPYEDDDPGGPAGFDVAGHVLRARRRGDLSQRELAEVLGVSQSTVNRYEQEGAEIGVGRLSQVLAEAGLRLTVVDEDGQEVQPVDRDVVRDNGGRRFPAHLDVYPPDLVPSERIGHPRYDRLPPQAWYHHRTMRDCFRAVREAPVDEVDHPTTGELRRRRLLQARRRAEASVIYTTERRLGAAARLVWARGTWGVILRQREEQRARERRRARQRHRSGAVASSA